MNRRKKKKEKIDFLLRNKHYLRLNLFLYLTSIFLIILIYFLSVYIFSAYSHSYIISGFFSLIIGFYLVYNRDHIVKNIGENIEFRKRERRKKENKEALKTTIKHITPKSNRIKLNIKPKINIKEKVKNTFSKKRNGEKKDYIEIK